MTSSAVYTFPGIMKDPKHVNPYEVIIFVTNLYGIDYNDIFIKRRFDKLPEARYLFYYIMKKTSTMSLKDMASIFKQDHATVVHGVKTIARRLETKQLLLEKEQFNKLRRYLYETSTIERKYLRPESVQI